MIILFGLYNFIKEYIRAENEKDKNNISEDYLEAQLKIFFNVGHLIEKKEKKQFKKLKEENKNFKEDLDALDDAYYDMIEMIDDLEDRTEKLLEKENLTKIGKAEFRLSELFFKFLEFLLEKDIDIRMESLIMNLKEYRASGYTQKIKKIGAAKTLSEVQKDI